MPKRTVSSVAESVVWRDLCKKAGLELRKRKLWEAGDYRIGCFSFSLKTRVEDGRKKVILYRTMGIDMEKR